MSLAQAARSIDRARRRLEPGASRSGRSVFISYARPDRRLAAGLAAVLEARGYAPWWDTHLQPGEEFRDRIIARLRAALAVVVVWSDQAVASPWVRWEAEQGLKQRKLVPLAAAGFDVRDIWPPFNDLTTLRLDDQARLLAALQRLQR